MDVDYSGILGEHIITKILLYIEPDSRVFVISCCKLWAKITRRSVGIEKVIGKGIQHQAITASRHGYIELLELLYNQYGDNIWHPTVCAVASNIMCLKFACQNGCPMDSRTCSNAAERGALDCLKYAHENGCVWDARTCAMAAKGGHLACLMYAHENACPWDHRTCAWAAAQGSLECLCYAHVFGCKWDASTCHLAAQEGHIECLRYAHENGCDWNINTTHRAAFMGRLECLQYACENQCPPSYMIARYAAILENRACMEYAYAQGSPTLIRIEDYAKNHPEYTIQMLIMKVLQAQGWLKWGRLDTKWKKPPRAGSHVAIFNYYQNLYLHVDESGIKLIERTLTMPQTWTVGKVDGTYTFRNDVYNMFTIDPSDAVEVHPFPFVIQQGERYLEHDNNNEALHMSMVHSWFGGGRASRWCFQEFPYVFPFLLRKHEVLIPKVNHYGPCCAYADPFCSFSVYYFFIF